MAKRSNLVLLAVSVILAFISTLLVLNQVNRLQKKQVVSDTVPVLVVVHSLAAHQVVTSEDVTTRTIPKTAVDTNVESKPSNVVGHYTSTAWFAGQQVISNMVVDSPNQSTFPLSIPKGKVAFTVSDDAIIGVDHLISPGDHVNVLMSSNQSVRTILQNVLVLHVDNGPPPPTTGQAGQATSGQSNSNGSNPIDTLTLEVTPQQAQQLDYGYIFGQLHVALRNPSDPSVVTLPVVDNRTYGP